MGTGGGGAIKAEGSWRRLTAPGSGTSLGRMALENESPGMGQCVRCSPDVGVWSGKECKFVGNGGMRAPLLTIEAFGPL